jgi:hypothetical protein
MPSRVSAVKSDSDGSPRSGQPINMLPHQRYLGVAGRPVTNAVLLGVTDRREHFPGKSWTATARHQSEHESIGGPRSPSPLPSEA